MKSFKIFFIPAIIFLTTLALYATFPSNQYTAVDGSLRCLPYMNSTKWELHGNNHMLYPVNVMLWSRIMATLFNMKPKDPFDFIRIIELMNSFFAAVGVAMFFLILKKATSNIKISILGACALAFSNAFIVNAVNSNEPMVGFTISTLAIISTYAWLKSDRIFLGFIGAFLLSFSMATYQSMFLIAPSLIALSILFPYTRIANTAIIRNALTYISVSYTHLTLPTKRIV